MKFFYFILSLLLFISFQCFSQTTLTEDGNGNLNTAKVVAATSSGQSFFTGHQLGSGYANSLAIFSALTDNPNGTSNNFYDGQVNGVTNFAVRADGQGYFAGKVGIGTTVPGSLLTVNGNIRSNVANQGVGFIAYDDANAGNHIFSLTRQGNGVSISSYNGIGFVADATSGPTNNYMLYINNSGNVGIGTTNPDQLLTVNGIIHAKQVNIDLNVPAPDYVFDRTYNLKSLSEVNRYILLNKHLPEIPSAAAMAKDGVNVTELNTKLLQKVEELTLYIIQKDKQLNNEEMRVEELQQQANLQQKQMKSQQEQLDQLKTQLTIILNKQN